MAKLIALDHIQVGFREYHPGEALPLDDEARAAAWAKCGSAVWQEDDYEPPAYAKAKPAAATAGLPGLAFGGEATGDALVGRVPATYERTRGKWNT